MKVFTKFAIACLTLASASAEVKVPQSYLDHIKPLPKVMTSDSNPLTQDKIDLGRKLFLIKDFPKIMM